MKTYRVTVDGQTFEVTVEELKAAVASGGAAPSMPASAPPAAARTAPPAAPPAPKATDSPLLTLAAGERPIQAPMPGKILAVNVVPGESVAGGSVLLILEAMKMENDILAPTDGNVKAVKVQNGDTVNTGDLLVVLE